MFLSCWHTPRQRNLLAELFDQFLWKRGGGFDADDVRTNSENASKRGLRRRSNVVAISYHNHKACNRKILDQVRAGPVLLVKSNGEFMWLKLVTLVCETLYVVTRGCVFWCRC